jgi:phosphoserine phosphatase RsbX
MQDRIDAGEYVRPCDGETLSGDAALVHWDDDGVLVAVIDVLGHGPDAHELAVQLSGILSKWLTGPAAPSPQGALAVLHEAARGTRGAVAAVAWLDSRTLEGSVVGIGNVRCRLFGSVARTVEFREGVLGCRMRSQTPLSFVLRPADVLLLFSDGVPGRFKSSEYPSLTLDPAPAIASNIVRRFGKGIDDASCAVIRCRW